jgi:carboxymethylenebutenolidase
MIQRCYPGAFLWLSLFVPGCKPAAVTSISPSPPKITVTDVTLDSPSGPCQGKLVEPVFDVPSPAQRPGLLLIHEDRGLTYWELEQARKLVNEGYIIFAIDLYGGQKVEGVMDAHIMGRGLPEDRVLAALKASVSFLTKHPNVRADRIGVIGWDIGGGYALDAARRDPRLKACVICYGGVVTDAALLAPMQAAVLGIFAGKDEGISDETLNAFQKACQQAGKKSEIKVFPNSKHGFMNPASPEAGGVADPPATQAAWDAIDSFLAAELKKP